MAIGVDNKNKRQPVKGGGRKTPPPNRASSKRSEETRKPKTKTEDMDFEEDDEDDEVELDDSTKKKTSKVDPKVIGIAAVGVGIVVVACMLFMGNDNTEIDPTLDTAQEVIEEKVEDAQPSIITDVDGNPVYDSNGNVIGEDAINPGYVTTLDNEADGTVPAQVFDADDYISDINGVPIKAEYNVERVDVVYDYVEYEIKRAIIDNGMEMYWAEIEYEGKKFRSQMSYTRASKFKPKGIARAQLEVLNVVGGGKVITYIVLETD